MHVCFSNGQGYIWVCIGPSSGTEVCIVAILKSGLIAKHNLCLSSAHIKKKQTKQQILLTFSIQTIMVVKCGLLQHFSR